MRIQGRIRGLRAGEELTLVLEGPDGSKRTMILPPATDRDAAFEIASESAAVAPGAFAWKLRLGPKSEALIFGAVVSPPQHPRVLILQASPTVEGGRLQRWLVDSGTPVVSRTRVSADHFRFMSNNGNADEFDRIDSTILAKFDVVITHEPALAALSDTERVALETAARGPGPCQPGEVREIAARQLPLRDVGSKAVYQQQDAALHRTEAAHRGPGVRREGRW
jgi:hypothetical protein